MEECEGILYMQTLLWLDDWSLQNAKKLFDFTVDKLITILVPVAGIVENYALVL